MRKAFTLAEILITLGIIGVVAAITMPTLIANYQKTVTVNQLKKVYSVLNQAYQKGILENGNVVNWEDWNGIYTQPQVKYLLPYLDVVKVITHKGRQLPGYSIMTSNGLVATQFWVGGGSYGPYILSDGTFLVFVNHLNNEAMLNSLFIIVDLNGLKGPNRMGRDVFVFTINNNQPNIITTPYSNKTVKQIIDSKNNCAKKGEAAGYPNYIGMGCSTIIMKDGWKIEKHYPWW